MCQGNILLLKELKEVIFLERVYTTIWNNIRASIIFTSHNNPSFVSLQVTSYISEQREMQWSLKGPKMGNLI